MELQHPPILPAKLPPQPVIDLRMPEDITELSLNSSRADTSYSRFQPASAHRTWRRFISATVMTASFSVTESVTTQECHLVLTSMGSLEGGLRCSDGRWRIILTPRPMRTAHLLRRYDRGGGDAWKLLHAPAPVKPALEDLFFAPCSPLLSCLPTARRRAIMALKLAAESLCCQG